MVRSRNKKSICSFEAVVELLCVSRCDRVDAHLQYPFRWGQVCHPSRRANRALDASADRSPPRMSQRRDAGCTSIGALWKLPGECREREPDNDHDV